MDFIEPYIVCRQRFNRVMHEIKRETAWIKGDLNKCARLGNPYEKLDTDSLHKYFYHVIHGWILLIYKNGELTTRECICDHCERHAQLLAEYYARNA